MANRKGSRAKRIYAVKATGWKKAQSPRTKATLLKTIKRALNKNPEAKIVVTETVLVNRTKDTAKRRKKLLAKTKLGR